MTIQEMFNKAYLGLASQGFQRCISEDGRCVYSSNDATMHCAWGWVDPSLGPEVTGSVKSLRDNSMMGVAATLSESDLIFALELQNAHDSAADSKYMRTRLGVVARNYNLTIPEVP